MVDPRLPRCNDCLRRGLECDGKSLRCARYQRGVRGSDQERPADSASYSASSTASQKPKGNGAAARKKKDFTSNRRPKPPTQLAVSDPPQWARSLTTPQNKYGFIYLLQEYYFPPMPDFVEQRQKEIPYTRWIIAARDAAMTSNWKSLDDSLLACALAHVVVDPQRQECNRQDLSLTGLSRYTRALKGLKASIESIESGELGRMDDSKMDAILVTTFCCVMYEAVANRSFTSLLHHLQGVGALIKARGVQNLRSPIARRTFQEYRSTMLTMDLAFRRSTFLSSPEYLNPPWKRTDPHSQCNLQEIIDMGYLLPPLMESLDSNKAAIEANSDAEKIVRSLRGLVRRAWRAESSLVSWEHKHMRRRETFISHPSQSKTDQGAIYPVTYTFSDFDLASAWVYGEMMKIYLYDLFVEATLLAPPKSYYRVDVGIYSRKAIKAADNVCMSLDYFLVDNKKITTRLVCMAPFQAGKTLFEKLAESGTPGKDSKEALKEKIRFCEMVYGRAQELGFPAWQS